MPIPSLLRTCSNFVCLQQIHAQIVHKGLEKDVFIINLFIGVCISLRDLLYATSVFNGVPKPSVFLWNCLIEGHCRKSSVAQTLQVFNCMKRSETLPDRHTFPPLINACSTKLAVRGGMMLHGSSMRHGWDGNEYVKTSLIDMYGKCRAILSARKLFDEMPDRSVVSWTAMIVGYMNTGDAVQAMKLFDKMPMRNVVTWNAMISGFVKLGDFTIARELFGAMPERNVVSFMTMINGHAKAGDMASARHLFELSPTIDITVWSTLISGYARNGQPDEAVKIFLEMCSRNVKPDEFIMSSMMSACSQLGNLELAKWVDSFVDKCVEKSLVSRAHVMAARIAMNAKCGDMERASELFEELPSRDVVLYCSMVKCLSMHGRGVEAVDLFGRMLREGLAPDSVAFTVILTACSHAGLVKEGCYFFDVMVNAYSITPCASHFACMVDLLGRSGLVKEAYELLDSVPMEQSAAAWASVLGACELYCNTDIADAVARRLSELEPRNPDKYVLMSNAYATAGRWWDVSSTRDVMKERGLAKVSGRSWV